MKQSSSIDDKLHEKDLCTILSRSPKNLILRTEIRLACLLMIIWPKYSLHQLLWLCYLQELCLLRLRRETWRGEASSVRRVWECFSTWAALIHLLLSCQQMKNGTARAAATWTQKAWEKARKKKGRENGESRTRMSQ